MIGAAIPALANVMQLAWITPDMDRSLEQFKTLYRVPEFLTLDLTFPATIFGQQGEMKMKVSLANIDHMQIELIQPMGGIDSIYRDVLPKDGSHANVFHHVCVQVYGSLEDWDAYAAALEPEQKIVYTGNIGPQGRVLYTDTRETLGIYLEHVWFTEENQARMRGLVPTYTTR
jgi:hypothetical protein